MRCFDCSFVYNDVEQVIVKGHKIEQITYSFWMIECSTKIFEITQYSNFCHLHSITHICNPLSRSKHCSNNVELIKYKQYENTSLSLIVL